MATLDAVAQAMIKDQDRARHAIAAWLTREGVELDKRVARRFFQRVYVRKGASYPWPRLLEANNTDWMRTALEWAQSKRGW